MQGDAWTEFQRLISVICTQRCLNREQQKNYQDGKSHMRKFQRGRTTSKHMLKNAWNDIANWQLQKVSSPCLDDHQIKKEKLENTGELSEVCSQVVLKCMELARMGGPDILWSVSKFARSVTKWTQACDRRLARLISYIHHTSGTDSIVMWVTRLSIVDWVCSKTQILLATLRTQKINLGVNLVYFWKSNIFLHQLDVQETNVSIPQFHKVGKPSITNPSLVLGGEVRGCGIAPKCAKVEAQIHNAELLRAWDRFSVSELLTPLRRQLCVWAGCTEVVWGT